LDQLLTKYFSFEDIQGKPSKYYDGFEIQNVVEQYTEEVAWGVIGSFNALFKKGNTFVFIFIFIFIYLFIYLKRKTKKKNQTNKIPTNISQAFDLPFTIQVAEDQGPRPKMEDKYVTALFANELIGLSSDRVSIVSVYDGHGGTLASEYIAKHLHINLMRDEDFIEDPAGAMRESFLSTNESFFQYCEREGLGDNVGSTAVLTMIRDSKLWVGWAGDSEACLYRSTGEVIKFCEPTHKPWIEKEKERIEMKGGTVEERAGQFRVCGALAVSRAFGDSRYRQFITSEPDIVCVDLQGTEEFLVVGCDGLWDVMSATAVGTFLGQYRGSRKEGMTDALVHHARSLGSTDNITVAVLIFNNTP